MENIQSIITHPDEQIEKLKKELGDRDIQLIVVHHTLEDAKLQLKREVKKTKMLDALD